MTNLRGDPLRVAAARADFLEFGAAASVGVAPVVAASWARSQSAGVDADVYRVTHYEDVDFDSRLARCARPVLERLAQDMAEVPVTIALTDAKARLIARKDCSSAVGRVLDRVNFQPGCSFDEGGVGTNGVGTVFEVGAPVSVVGAEHFNQALIPFACSGAPIIDPFTRRVAGVLDVSTLAESWSPLFQPLLSSAAAEIAHNLTQDRSRSKRALFEAYLLADARNQPVIAVGDGTIVNSRAGALLNPAEQASVRDYAQFQLQRGRRGAHHLELEDGRTIQLRWTPIVHDSDVLGLVIVVNERIAATQQPALPSSSLASPGVMPDMRTNAARTLHNELVQTFSQNQDVLVVGESGSGKRTSLTTAFRVVAPTARIVVVDVDHFDYPTVLESIRNLSESSLVMFCHIDTLTLSSYPQITALLAAAKLTGASVAATTGDGDGPDAKAEYEKLLIHFDQSVSVPPIRFRSEDIEAIATSILGTIAPGRPIRLSPEALRIMQTFQWPRNITQMREALTAAAHRRPAGEIQAEDLPGYCRTSKTQALTNLQITERDAIVRALEHSAGNRVQAAAALGISRSSLYRKIRSYAIIGV
ncbi:UNVERIFIED_CONTAM: regulatory Fis family protein [Williamsia faeni]